MVNHHWIESKLIKYERAKQTDAWNLKKEQQYKYLLELYHTGRFSSLSIGRIARILKQLGHPHFVK